MTERTVLISGAGIAGPTLAHWLARGGYRPTLVERARYPRSSGSPVDVRGPAMRVAERMGLVDALRAAATRTDRLTFHTGEGRRTGRVDMGALRRAAASREVELPRGTLAALLQDSCRDDVELRLGDSITALAQDADGVDVEFERAAPRRFDLVVGADGVHSTVRRLAFGPERRFVRHAGLYVATLPLGGPAPDPREILMYNTPGRAVSIHPSRGEALAAFIYRHPEVPDFDHRDLAQHRRLVTEAYAGIGWRVPELLERVATSTDLYFDAVSQVRMPRWSDGRIALLGDAASCLSLFGDGSTLAIAGAFTLATALTETPDDPAGAFARYEAEHRRLVGPRQRGVGTAAALLVPATRPGITVRDLATRLWPLAAAGSYVGRSVGRSVGRTGRRGGPEVATGAR